MKRTSYPQSGSLPFAIPLRQYMSDLCLSLPVGLCARRKILDNSRKSKVYSRRHMNSKCIRYLLRNRQVDGGPCRSLNADVFMLQLLINGRAFSKCGYNKRHAMLCSIPKLLVPEHQRQRRFHCAHELGTVQYIEQVGLLVTLLLAEFVLRA